MQIFKNFSDFDDIRVGINLGSFKTENSHRGRSRKSGEIQGIFFPPIFQDKSRGRKFSGKQITLFGEKTARKEERKKILRRDQHRNFLRPSLLFFSQGCHVSFVTP